MGLDQWIFKKDPEFDYESGEQCDDESVIYWRKAYAIHNYMEELYDGVRNCGNYPITIGELKKLRNTCQKVFDDHSLAEELLPDIDPYEQYDRWYFMQIENTITQINNLIKTHEPDDEYYYHAWW